ncbi:Putative metabolite transport protein NicT [Cupriavidus yeoncheonensis]|uniref:Metabolite transport protein NicT n=1 Tax=Cupriavidus yeoncheonensis TaxID=1462994 RepID=A0A916N752_9BURK|nr:MFS transporter [Cupriavidus yeoncheonensis]CAG2157696.1 Putative metabolite transport protein NicT [Cupriavidus yeoncheonensis]
MSSSFPRQVVSGVADLATQSDVYGKVAWRLIPLFCLCYIAAYLDRINVGLARLQMLDALSFSETVYGLGAGLFFVGYIIFEVPSNLVLQRVGARFWIARIMITWGLLSAATAFVRTPTQFYVLRFLLGAAEAGFVPGILLYLTCWFPTYRRGKVIAWFMLGIPLASMTGAPLSGWIMTAFAGWHGWAGWQWMFVIEAVPSVVLGVIVLCCLPNSIQKAAWLTPAEKQQLTRNLEADTLAEPRHSLRAVFTDHRIWMLGLIDMCLLMGTYTISFWLPTIIRDSGVQSPLDIGLLTAIPNAVAVVAMLFNGAHSDRERERRWHIVVPVLLGAAGMVASTWFTHDTAATVALMTVAAAGISAGFPVFWCLPATFLQGRAAAGGIALACSVANLGGFAATFVVGWLKDLTHSPNAGLVLFGAFQLLACAIALSMPARVVNR